MKLLSTILLVWAALAFLVCCLFAGAKETPNHWLDENGHG